MTKGRPQRKEEEGNPQLSVWTDEQRRVHFHSPSPGGAAGWESLCALEGRRCFWKRHRQNIFLFHVHGNESAFLCMAFLSSSTLTLTFCLCDCNQHNATTGWSIYIQEVIYSLFHACNLLGNRKWPLAPVPVDPVGRGCPSLTQVIAPRCPSERRSEGYFFQTWTSV